MEIRSLPYPIDHVFNVLIIKLLTRLKGGLNHLNERRFNHILKHALIYYVHATY